MIMIIMKVELITINFDSNYQENFGNNFSIRSLLVILLILRAWEMF